MKYMKEKFYEITKETEINEHGIRLYRIVALRNFTVQGVEIKTGRQGGFIEKEENLMQDGSWVWRSASVYGNAVVKGGTLVNLLSKIFDNAVLDNCKVRNCDIYGNCKLSDGEFYNIAFYRTPIIPKGVVKIQNYQVYYEDSEFDETFATRRNNFLKLKYVESEGHPTVHFELTKNTKGKLIKGRKYTLYQIKATRDFIIQRIPTETSTIVKKGQLGGWIEKEENIIQNSTAWVDEKSIICDDAVIKDSAYIENGCIISNKSSIGGAVTINDSNISNTCSIQDIQIGISYCNLDKSPILTNDMMAILIDELFLKSDMENNSISVKVRKDRFKKLKFKEDEYVDSNKHYKLVKITPDSFRIVAIKEFRTEHVHVRKGEYGGIITSEKNLVQGSNAWISRESFVIDNAVIKDNVYICIKSKVSGNAEIKGNCKIEKSTISESCKLSGNLEIINSFLYKTPIFKVDNKIKIVKDYVVEGLNHPVHVVDLDYMEKDDLTVHYEIVKSYYKNIGSLGNHVKLWQIKATRDFKINIPEINDSIYIRKGDKGGFISSEKNLVQGSNGWVKIDSEISDNAEVCCDVIISNSKLSGNAKIIKALAITDCEIYDDAIINGNYIITSSKVFKNCSLISDNKLNIIQEIKLSKSPIFSEKSSSTYLNGRQKLLSYSGFSDESEFRDNFKNLKYTSKSIDTYKLDVEKPKNKLNKLISYLKDSVKVEEVNFLKLTFQGEVCIFDNNIYKSINDDNELVSYPKNLIIESIPVMSVNKEITEIKKGELVITNLTCIKVTKITSKYVSGICLKTGELIENILPTLNIITGANNVRVVINLLGNIKSNSINSLLLMTLDEQNIDSKNND